MLHIRGILGAGAIATMFFAVQYLPIADAVVFTFLAPVLITVAAPFVLGEDSGRQWLPVLAAMLGVLLICQPSVLFGDARLTRTGVITGLLHSCFSAAGKVKSLAYVRLACVKAAGHRGPLGYCRAEPCLPFTRPLPGLPGFWDIRSHKQLCTVLHQVSTCESSVRGP